MSVKKLYKNGFSRAITFSFDDGQPQDMRLIEIMNRYGLKGTFNLMGGKCNNPCFRIKTDESCLWDGSDALKKVYKGHEIASHGYTHLRMTELDDNTCKEEIDKDVAALKTAFGCEINGFAAPYGAFDQRVINSLKENGIRYLRAVKKNDDFAPPEDFYNWKPNGHIALFMGEDAKENIKEFFTCETELPVLYIWGHSYEFTDYNCAGSSRWEGMTNRWEKFEETCRLISDRDDTWYATNIEICDYINAMRKANVNDTYIDNLSDTELFFNINGRLIIAPPHSRFGL